MPVLCKAAQARCESDPGGSIAGWVQCRA